MSELYYCSLIKYDQIIKPNNWWIVKFPFGSESTDPHKMHEAVQPNGTVIDDNNNWSGLIWPKCEGIGILDANLHWEAGGYTELRDRFVRNPFGYPSPVTPAYDSTATDHRPKSPGMQCFTKFHNIVVHPTVPLGLFVYHNDTVPRKLIMAQFKLTILSPLSPPSP